MDRGAWWATVHGVGQDLVTKQQQHIIFTLSQKVLKYLFGGQGEELYFQIS